MKSRKFNLLDKTEEVWLQNKKDRDGAEDLWRIHDNLYDVSDFIKKHPGGQFWLECTKGTDITEAFESHHVKSNIPEQILNTFYVRKAKTSRSSQYTFEENGFYKTLKRRVNEELITIPEKESKSSDVYIDLLMISTLTTAILANMLGSYKLAMITGLFGALTINAAHNYCHQRDNFRMYYIDVCSLNSKQFRIIHILSHHFYPNSTSDVQVSFLVPFIIAFPEKKSFIVKYMSWIYGPFIIFPLVFHGAAALRLVSFIYYKKPGSPDTNNLLPLLMPLCMYIFSGQTLLATIGLWQIIILSESFWFNITALTNGHFHPEIYIEGDTGRPNDELDWGINQLDTISDRYGINGNKFLVLVVYGNHALHHLFPTLDHAVLDHLYPVSLKTMEEFNVGVRMMNQTDMFLGYFRRLANETKNPHSPGLLKSCDLN